jgi:hypothetical protein
MQDKIFILGVVSSDLSFNWFRAARTSAFLMEMVFIMKIYQGTSASSRAIGHVNMELLFDVSETIPFSVIRDGSRHTL